MAGSQLFSLKKKHNLSNIKLSKADPLPSVVIVKHGLLENPWFDDFPFQNAQPVHKLIIFVALWKLNIAIIMNIGKLC